jgi:hypothetical protein
LGTKINCMIGGKGKVKEGKKRRESNKRSRRGRGKEDKGDGEEEEEEDGEEESRRRAIKEEVGYHGWSTKSVDGRVVYCTVGHSLKIRRWIMREMKRYGCDLEGQLYSME